MSENLTTLLKWIAIAACFAIIVLGIKSCDSAKESDVMFTQFDDNHGGHCVVLYSDWPHKPRAISCYHK